MTVNTPVGLECKAYRNTGTHAAPVWVECKRLKDVTVALQKDRANVSRRESAWKMERGALKGLEITAGYQYRRGTDATRDAFIDSFVNGTPVEMAVMDDDITTSGAKGWRSYIEVMGIPTNEPLADGKTLDLTLALTDHEESSVLIEPDHYTVA